MLHKKLLSQSHKFHMFYRSTIPCMKFRRHTFVCRIWEDLGENVSTLPHPERLLARCQCCLLLFQILQCFRFFRLMETNKRSRTSSLYCCKLADRCQLVQHRLLNFFHDSFSSSRLGFAMTAIIAMTNSVKAIVADINIHF